MDRRILITLDKDFGELAIVFAQPHSGIVRLANIRVSEQAAAIQQVLDSHGEKLALGALITVEPGRVRVRVADV